MNNYFITEAYIRELTSISANVDPKLIFPQVGLAEDMYIKNILGSKLFDELKISYVAQTLTNDEITLVAKIKPALAFRAYELSIPQIHLQVRNKGVVKQDSDYAKSSEFSEMKYIRDEIKNYAEYYEEKLIQYLCDYSSLYPSYTNYDNKGVIPDQSSSYDSDLFIDSMQYPNKNNKYYGPNYGN